MVGRWGLTVLLTKRLWPCRKHSLAEQVHSQALARHCRKPLTGPSAAGRCWDAPLYTLCQLTTVTVS